MAIPSSLILLCILLGLVVIALTVQNARLHGRIESRARAQHEEWLARDLARAESEIRAAAEARARGELEAWKSTHEAHIRRDALERSRASSTGKATEHLAPYFDEFPYDPRDARFLGSPVDFLVFDGLGRGELRQIVFAEVKTGPSASLSARERQVRDAVQAGRIRWAEVRLADVPPPPAEGSFYLALEEAGGGGSGQLELLSDEKTLRHWRDWTENPREYGLDPAGVVRRSGKTCLRLGRSDAGDERFTLELGEAARLDVDLSRRSLNIEDGERRSYRLSGEVLGPKSNELLLALKGGR